MRFITSQTSVLPMIGISVTGSSNLLPLMNNPTDLFAPLRYSYRVIYLPQSFVGIYVSKMHRYLTVEKNVYLFTDASSMLAGEYGCRVEGILESSLGFPDAIMNFMTLLLGRTARSPSG